MKNTKHTKPTAGICDSQPQQSPACSTPCSPMKKDTSENWNPYTLPPMPTIMIDDRSLVAKYEPRSKCGQSSEESGQNLSMTDEEFLEFIERRKEQRDRQDTYPGFTIMTPSEIESARQEQLHNMEEARRIARERWAREEEEARNSGK